MSNNDASLDGLKIEYPKRRQPVVSLDEYRPHKTGEAICLSCNREWVAVAPVDVKALECPSCHLDKGAFKDD